MGLFDTLWLLLKEIFSLSSFLGTFTSSFLFLAALYIISKRRRSWYVSQPLQSATNDVLLPDEKPVDYPNELRSFLSSIKVFGYIEEPVFFEIIKSVQTMKLKPGDIISDLDQAIYLINSGTINVFAGDAAKEEHIIHQAGPKSSILSLYSILYVVCGVSGDPCHVTACAISDADVIRLPHEAFSKLRDQYPQSINQLIQVALARFQRVTCATLNRYFGLTAELLKKDVNQFPTSPFSSKRVALMEEDELHNFILQRVSEMLGISDSLNLSEHVNYQTFEEGEVLVARNEVGSGIQVVLEGEVEVSMFDLNDKKTVVDTVHEGGLAGHWTFITGCPSLIEIKAKTGCRVATLTKSSFDVAMEKNPSLWFQVAKKMLNQLSPLVRQIDFALEWLHFNAGQVLYRQGEESDDIYLVINGRLRGLVKRAKGESEFFAEYTPGDAVGDVDAITQTPRSVSIHAVRDSELARIPRHLFYFLALRYPQAMIQISRGIAVKSQQALSLAKSNLHQHKVKTIAILPVSTDESIPIDLFTQCLLLELNNIGPSVMLDNATVLQHLGKNAFTSVGELKLHSWLEEQEETYRIVLYKADQVGTPWMQRCVRQADLILLLAVSYNDPREGDVETYLKASKNTVRKELVLLHNHHYLAPGTTFKWLQNRPWIQMHHHILLTMNSVFKRQMTLPIKRLSKAESSSGLRDIARLARYLTKESVAVVFGGGGARGLAHIGVLKAMEEAGIPIDMVGGTSMGAFIGGLYARDVDTVSILGWAKKFCSKMSSTTAMAWDLTYPVAAWFSGAAFNRVLKKIFSDQQIEDLWLNYFCVTTNISKSRLEVHRSGTLWRYCRASMSLSGFMPPLCDRGDMLVDGGYLNNVPADIMKSISGAKRIIAIDVAIADDSEPINYGDSLSGWWVIFNSINPFGVRVKVPTIAEIQSRLAYVSCNNILEEVKKMEGCIYVQPPITPFKLMDFHKYEKIIDVGYQYGRELIEKWRDEGLFSEFLESPKTPITTKRRNSH